MSKRSTSSSVGDDRLVVGVAPAEQREVVAHRLGQVAGVAQLLDRRRAVALGELLAVGAVQQRQVGVDAAARRPSASKTSSCLGVLERWSSPRTTWRDAGVEVVDGDREVVERRCRRRGRSRGRRGGRAGRRVAADEVVDDGLALVGDAQADRALGLGVAAEAAVGAVLRPCRP